MAVVVAPDRMGHFGDRAVAAGGQVFLRQFPAEVAEKFPRRATGRQFEHLAEMAGAHVQRAGEGGQVAILEHMLPQELFCLHDDGGRQAAVLRPDMGAGREMSGDNVVRQGGPGIDDVVFRPFPAALAAFEEQAAENADHFVRLHIMLEGFQGTPRQRFGGDAADEALADHQNDDGGVGAQFRGMLQARRDDPDMGAGEGAADDLALRTAPESGAAGVLGYERDLVQRVAVHGAARGTLQGEIDSHLPAMVELAAANRCGHRQAVDGLIGITGRGGHVTGSGWLIAEIASRERAAQ